MSEPARSGVCALVPAAGRATRLGALAEGTPKLLLDLGDGATVWSLIHAALAPHVERVHVVLSPEGEPLFAARGEGSASPRVTTSVQPVARGMGDAIFGAHAAWRDHATLLVVWGDQACLSTHTVARCLAEHARRVGPRMTLPLARVRDPYVQVDLDAAAGRLLGIRQSREGDAMDAEGDADVGVFCLETAGLADAWAAYLGTAARGARTGEVNFLPFLPWLSRERGWDARGVAVDDPDEARGINAPADLAFVRERLRRR